MGESYSLNIISILQLATILSFLPITSRWLSLYKNSEENYKNIYLISHAVFIYIIAHFLLIIYTIYVIDDLSSILKGAMCGAGVAGENPLLEVFVSLKILTSFFATLFYLLYKENERDSQRIHLKKILFIYPLFLFSLLLESGTIFVASSGFESSKIVSCCSTIFAQKAEIAEISISPHTLIAIYNTSAMVIMFSSLFRSWYLQISILPIYCIFGYLSYIYFYTPYIYELPTHKCPYCALHIEYYFIGFLYFLLFFISINATALYSAIGLLTKKQNGTIKNLSFYSTLILLIGLNLQPLIYYIKNGVSLN